MPNFEDIKTLAGLWRVVIVLAGGMVALFGVFGIFGITSLTSHEKWQVPLVGILLLLTGAYWLKNQPPSREERKFDVVTPGETPWPQPAVSAAKTTLYAGATPPQSTALLRLNRPQALAARATLGFCWVFVIGALSVVLH
ncbi:MAG: hypothetical protein K1X78_10075 [Verrucomicrobiaceae bacterium]|nr:hypothetical protein [Verrucomicrobiaceae bacterium]